MGLLDSLTGFLRDVRASYQERLERRRRQREAGVRPGDRVRDGVSDALLRVDSLSEHRANEYTINGTPLSTYGKNAALECGTDVVVECHSPGRGEIEAYPASRLVSLELAAGDVARDRFTGNVLSVQQIHEAVAGDWRIDDTPLAEYDVNQRLDCADDWVVECSYHYARSRQTYEFPLSRLVPGEYPTAVTEWKERVVDSTKCFSCRDGEKQHRQHSACQNCRARIFARDNRVCQQKGCTTTKDLAIHHLWYEPNPVTGTIPDRYLIVLCDDHHRARHGIDESQL